MNVSVVKNLTCAEEWGLYPQHLDQRQLAQGTTLHHDYLAPFLFQKSGRCWWLLFRGDQVVTLATCQVAVKSPQTLNIHQESAFKALLTTLIYFFLTFPTFQAILSFVFNFPGSISIRLWVKFVANEPSATGPWSLAPAPRSACLSIPATEPRRSPPSLSRMYGPSSATSSSSSRSCRQVCARKQLYLQKEIASTQFYVFAGFLFSLSISIHSYFLLRRIVSWNFTSSVLLNLPGSPLWKNLFFVRYIELSNYISLAHASKYILKNTSFICINSKSNNKGKRVNVIWRFCWWKSLTEPGFEPLTFQPSCSSAKLQLSKVQTFLTRQNSSSTATGFLTTAFDPSSRRPSRRGSSTFSTPSWRCGPASDASIRNSSRPSRTKSLPSWRSTRTSSARARAGERTPAASGRSVATCWQTPASATLASTAPTWGTSPSTARSSLHRVNLPDLSLVQKLRVFE